ncbi:hypothetical protein LOZ65_001820 [Ophidiomyces ophidiicola]|nr:hypothetical protein LOZ65_001820 [Ophidiomyces ophidiicola]
MDATHTNGSEVQPPEKPGRPSPRTSPEPLFVYGSLMDTDVIQIVLDLPAPPPPLRAAKLRNYKMKMWHIYPTLVPHEGSEVHGLVYLVEQPDHFERLEKYETPAYTWCARDVEMDDGSIESCRVFVWAGDPDSDQLHDGEFSLEEYQNTHKQRLFGKA